MTDEGNPQQSTASDESSSDKMTHLKDLLPNPKYVLVDDHPEAEILNIIPSTEVEKVVDDFLRDSKKLLRGKTIE
jgi:hypothetical protein